MDSSISSVCYCDLLMSHQSLGMVELFVQIPCYYALSPVTMHNIPIKDWCGFVTLESYENWAI